nr:MAG TPA: hypothetical protein [Caudoviricetes sp.]
MKREKLSHGDNKRLLLFLYLKLMKRRGKLKIL